MTLAVFPAILLHVFRLTLSNRDSEARIVYLSTDALVDL